MRRMALPSARRAAALVAIGAGLLAASPLHGQDSYDVVTETLRLEARPGADPGSLVLPVFRGPSRPPPVVLIAAWDLTLGPALAARGVAALEVPGPAGGPDRQSAASGLELELAAAWITRLRNDTRFRTVSALATGTSTDAAAGAVRVARADALVLLDGTTDEPLSVPVHAAGSRVDAAADEIAAFLLDVRPIGLRGRQGGRRTTPRLSPRATAITILPGSGARLSLEYGQPARRGREVWGRLVRWDRVWMPGADEATTFTTTAALTLGDSLIVEPGDYTLYALPRADGATLIVSRETGQFHTVYNESQDLGRVEMTMRRREDVTERMTFLIEARGVTPAPAVPGGTLILRWDDREYSAPFTVRPARRP